MPRGAGRRSELHPRGLGEVETPLSGRCVQEGPEPPSPVVPSHRQALASTGRRGTACCAPRPGIGGQSRARSERARGQAAERREGAQAAQRRLRAVWRGLGPGVQRPSGLTERSAEPCLVPKRPWPLSGLPASTPGCPFFRLKRGGSRWALRRTGRAATPGWSWPGTRLARLCLSWK